MRAAIYARISDDRRGDGLGVERQEQLCRKLASDRGWTVARVYADNDISAYTGKRRPSYEQMLSDIENGLLDAVICVDLDRLTRAPIELERFILLADSKHIELANVSGNTDLSTDDGRFKARIMGAVARQESDKKSSRIKRQRAQAAQRGMWSGPVPFGYQEGMVPDADEAKLIQQAAADILTGRKSWRSLAIEWNEKGLRTRRGNTWSANAVRINLTSPSLAGLSVHQGEVVGTGSWEPILDIDTHEALKALNKRRKGKPGRPPTLLTGLLTCGVCGGSLYAGNRGNGIKTYVCRVAPGEREGCGRLSIKRDPLEGFIVEQVVKDALSLTKEMPRRHTSDSAETVRLQQQLVALEARADELAALYGEGDLSLNEFKAARQANTARMAAIQQEIAQQSAELSLPLDDLQEIIEKLKPARGEQRPALDHKSVSLVLSDEQIRSLIKGRTDRIVILPYDRSGRRDFNPNRVAITFRQ